MNAIYRLVIALTILCMSSCHSSDEGPSHMDVGEYTGDSSRLHIYAPFELTTELSGLTSSQKKMLPLLVKAAKVMDTLFWKQSFGDPAPFLHTIENPEVLEFARINYGPWDRLAGNSPFLSAFGPKPKGAQFYPDDMTKEEFETVNLDGKEDPYTLIRRNEEGELVSIPYHEAYQPYLKRAAGYLKAAESLAENTFLRTYLGE